MPLGTEEKGERKPKRKKESGYTYMAVVGDTPIQQVAFLWSRDATGVGKMVINLNNLPGETGKNYLVFSATGIDDNGQIAASAYYMPTGAVHAVLLNPFKKLTMISAPRRQDEKANSVSRTSGRS